MDAQASEEVYELLAHHLSECTRVKECLDRWVRLGALLRQQWSPQLSEETVDAGLDELEVVFEEYEEAIVRSAAELVCSLADRAKSGGSASGATVLG